LEQELAPIGEVYAMPNKHSTMRQTISFLFVLTLLNSCKGQDQFVQSRLKTADKFVACLKNNTPDKILDLTYPAVDDKIDDKESRDFHVNKAYKLIQKFGIPSKDKWIIKYDPENNFDRLLITIPIFNGYDTTFDLLHADIIIKFPPPQISDKIYSYEIADKYVGKPTIPVPTVPSTDTTRKSK
jgi:hypothetical protein